MIESQHIDRREFLRAAVVGAAAPTPGRLEVDIAPIKPGYRIGDIQRNCHDRGRCARVNHRWGHRERIESRACRILRPSRSGEDHSESQDQDEEASGRNYVQPAATHRPGSLASFRQSPL